MFIKLFSLFEGKHYRYILVGFLTFGINYVAADLIFSISFFTSSLFAQNLGNLLATEIALIASFPLHNWITWLGNSEQLFRKLLRFHAISFFGICLRLTVFALLVYLGFSWTVATVLSIAVIVLFNFIGFDLFVFSESANIIANEEAYSKEGTGTEVLETIEEAKTYNRWMAEKVTDYLGAKNLELGAGKGTIAAFVAEGFPLVLYDLSESNQNHLKQRFVKQERVLKIGGDIFHEKDWESYDCIYSSNVLEHIPDELPILDHCLKLLKHGGFFVAIVPAMPLLYSAFDKKIGHFRRYSKKDRARWEHYLLDRHKVKWLDFSFFNPIGAIGWFLKMKLLSQTNIKKQDAMVMNSIIPFVSWLDFLPLGFGQSIRIVIKKL